MIERLRTLVGTAGVWSGAEAVAWAVRGRAPRAVVAPGSAKEAAAVFALATAEGWTAAPAGAGALLDSGRLPTAPDLVVTTARLAGITAYEPADLVVSVGAGTTLGALRERLAEAGQWSALDPPGGEAATVGAVVAAASAGPLREGYGTPRDQVLGLQLVTGDGRILELGGRVMKNVAGYDLVKLVVGSRGTLGIVTRVDLRLRALPECDWTIALGAESPAPLIELAAALREEWVAPVALELVSPAAWRGVEGRVAGAARSGLPGGGRVAEGAAGPRGARPGAGDGWVLLVRLQGNADAVAAALGRVRGVAERVGIHAGTGAETYTRAAWAAVDQLEAAAGLAVRLADRPAALEETLQLALRLPGGEAGLPIVAHAGAGIVRVLVESGLERPVGAPVDEWVHALTAARAEITGRRGTLIVARAPREVAARFDFEGALEPGVLRLLRGIRERFDPAGTLASRRSVP